MSRLSLRLAGLSLTLTSDHTLQPSLAHRFAGEMLYRELFLHRLSHRRSRHSICRTQAYRTYIHTRPHGAEICRTNCNATPTRRGYLVDIGDNTGSRLLYRELSLHRLYHRGSRNGCLLEAGLHFCLHEAEICRTNCNGTAARHAYLVDIGDNNGPRWLADDPSGCGQLSCLMFCQRLILSGCEHHRRSLLLRRA